jgi:hypothetical protein
MYKKQGRLRCQLLRKEEDVVKAKMVAAKIQAGSANQSGCTHFVGLNPDDF